MNDFDTLIYKILKIYFNIFLNIKYFEKKIHIIVINTYLVTIRYDIKYHV